MLEFNDIPTTQRTSSISESSPINMALPRFEEHKMWGTFFAFILVFLGWDTWDAWLAYLIEEAKLPSIIRLILNAAMLSVTVPILRGWNSFNPRIKAVCSVLSAVGVWDILEYLVSQIVTSKRETMIFYGTSLVLALAIVKIYEMRYEYDVIGNHLALLA